MKNIFHLISFLITMLVLFPGCEKENNIKQAAEAGTTQVNPLLGKWIRSGHEGTISIEFKEDGKMHCDYGNDNRIEVIAKYTITNDTVRILNIKGSFCNRSGYYKIYQTNFTIAFDLINDSCQDRIKTQMGFWTRPNYKELLDTLDTEIAQSADSKLRLNRARMYLALGNSDKARSDLDDYIAVDSSQARVFINRAATRFPYDMQGVITDCNRAIILDPNQKNAYFLRGLALYEEGEYQSACDDFSKAIELGFEVLKYAEQRKCAEYWNL